MKNDTNILVVDDSSTMRRIVVNTIKRLEIENVFEAEDGLKGLEIFNNNKIDVILTDWNMPIMNGLEFVIAIRKINPDIPIIMITTEGGKTQIITALKAGVNNYIIKPFTPQILKSKLESILF
jgi:two-component system, chemotaxis family, chemotaxis protein CheY